MIYYQIILQDKTPKRIVSLTEIDIEKACDLLVIKEKDILFFEKIEEKNIEKKPKIIKGKLTYVETGGAKK